MRCFHPMNITFYNTNEQFSGWPNRYIGQNKISTAGCIVSHHYWQVIHQNKLVCVLDILILETSVCIMQILICGVTIPMHRLHVFTDDCQCFSFNQNIDLVILKIVYLYKICVCRIKTSRAYYLYFQGVFTLDVSD